MQLRFMAAWQRGSWVEGNISSAPLIKDLPYRSFDSNTLADTLERDIKSSGATFSHVSPFVQTAGTQSAISER